MKRPSRGLRPLAWLGLVAAAALAAGCSSDHAGTVPPGKSPARLTVSSTLAGSRLNVSTGVGAGRGERRPSRAVRWVASCVTA